MTALPISADPIAEAIDAAYEAKADNGFRPHMGVSLLGHECDRYLWLTFRWAWQKRHSGRMLRLFRFGHDFEATAVEWLAMAGITVRATGADQMRVGFGGHVSGSIDGIASGLPQSGKGHVFECKTHSAKSFAEVKRHGVYAAKPMHWCQMQVYMLGTGLERALYFAFNKDTHEVYTERVRLDKAAAQALVERGKRIAVSDEMPDPVSTNPDIPPCLFCDFKTFCHETRTTNAVNCRTCAHSTAKPDGTWHCERWNKGPIPLDVQRKGCQDHVIHPALFPYPIDPEASTPIAAAYVIDGVTVWNGHADARIFSSEELLRDPVGCARTHAEVQPVMDAFPGSKVMEVRNAS